MFLIHQTLLYISLLRISQAAIPDSQFSCWSSVLADHVSRFGNDARHTCMPVHGAKLVARLPPRPQPPTTILFGTSSPALPQSLIVTHPKRDLVPLLLTDVGRGGRQSEAGCAPVSDRMVRRKPPSVPSPRPRAKMFLRVCDIVAWSSRPGDTLERTCKAIAMSANSSGVQLCIVSGHLRPPAHMEVEAFYEIRLFMGAHPLCGNDAGPAVLEVLPQHRRLMIMEATICGAAEPCL